MKQTWYYALLPGEMALGLFSTLLPLYVVGELGGSLVEVGMVAAVAGFSSIPASIFWGYLSDRMRRCRMIIASSFLFLGFTFIFLSGVKGIPELLVLSVMLGVFRSASPSVAGILIAESTSRGEWDSNVASYRFTLALGSLMGLVTGTLLVASHVYRGLLLLSSILI
ncbi:MAG: MFS transporter, partial [Candidatus Bathyarchaeota archaeon]|nr:MFS transporter [Candidatus Bathyarchaeota archaeon]